MKRILQSQQEQWICVQPVCSLDLNLSQAKYMILMPRIALGFRQMAYKRPAIMADSKDVEMKIKFQFFERITVSNNEEF